MYNNFDNVSSFDDLNSRFDVNNYSLHDTFEEAEESMADAWNDAALEAGLDLHSDEAVDAWVELASCLRDLFDCVD